MSIIDLEPTLEKPVRERNPSLVRARHVGIAILAIWILTSIYLVAPEQQAVVSRFGAVVEPRVMPGITRGSTTAPKRVTTACCSGATR